jgi:gamma-glutamylcyclotransferase (GGCT)/AIG2-like uncharacterized protein YtfP
MFEAVWQQILKGKYRKIDAHLNEFWRVKIHGEVYPGLVKLAGEQVEGVLVFGLSKRDIKLLDDFEGRYYKRTAVNVTADDGNQYAAVVYLIREKYNYLLTKKCWDFEKFRDRHLQQFLRTY